MYISNEQSKRLIELFDTANDVDHYEIEKSGAEVVDLHIKEYRTDGTVHNFFISDDGGSTIKGGVGMWGIVKAAS